MRLEKNWKQLWMRTKAGLVNDEPRRLLLLRFMNAGMAFVALMMSVVNFFTEEHVLMVVTFIYSLLCVLNLFYLRVRQRPWVTIAFEIESSAVLVFFLISGIPDGFSALWLCLIPCFSLFVFGRKNGTVFCLLLLAVMIVLFWIPAGQSLLRYPYSDTFMLRFPLLYLSMFLVSLLIEYVRGATYGEMLAAEEKYRFLYRHDALTGLYNRYGFDEMLTNTLKRTDNEETAILMIDIDDFKLVNDRYGHAAGDRVLKHIANLLIHSLCADCGYCRWGGEEFMVVMRCGHDPLETAEKLRECVENSVIADESGEIRVTVSVGVCISKETTREAVEQMISRADHCMYKAKGSGKNRVRTTGLRDENEVCD